MAARTASRMPAARTLNLLFAGEPFPSERSLSLIRFGETAGEGAKPVGDRPEGAVRTAPESSRCAILCS